MRFVKGKEEAGYLDNHVFGVRGFLKTFGNLKKMYLYIYFFCLFLIRLTEIVEKASASLRTIVVFG